MILLSFDTEEFDVPREHGVDFPLDEAMKVSVYGTEPDTGLPEKKRHERTTSSVQAILQKMRRR